MAPSLPAAFLRWGNLGAFFTLASFGSRVRIPPSSLLSSICLQFPFFLYGDLSFPILGNSLAPIASFPLLLVLCRPIRLLVVPSPVFRVPASAQLVGPGSRSI